MFWPGLFADLNIGFPTWKVLLDGSKSAEPPTRLSITFVRAFRTLPDETRVATGPSSTVKLGK